MAVLVGRGFLTTKWSKKDQIYIFRIHDRRIIQQWLNREASRHVSHARAASSALTIVVELAAGIAVEAAQQGQIHMHLVLVRDHLSLQYWEWIDQRS